MRSTPTDSELEYIPNIIFKRNAICQNYFQYGDNVDCQEYLMEQLEINPQLLAWIFDDSSLIGRSYLSLDSGRLEAFIDFYNSFSI